MMPSRELVYGSGHEWLSKVYHEQNDLTQPQCINNKHILKFLYWIGMQMYEKYSKKLYLVRKMQKY